MTHWRASETIDHRYDGVQRMTGAETGRGNLAGGTTQGTPLGSWTYSYGKADELLGITETTGGLQQYASGAEGRITSRTGPDGSEAFSYDGEGRRTEDTASRTTWDWRGRLVQVDPKTGDHAGERIGYGYDATGRLLSRTNLGAIPQGGTDADRPFIAKRAFVWDGQRLAAEAGLNFQDQPIWRQQYAPGQRGLDDAPLVRVEKDLQGTPSTSTYALLRDEMGTPIAVAQDSGSLPPPASGLPPLLARYLYAPYGQRHVELGPELLRIAFDATITKVGSTDQTPTANQAVGGALRIVTTSPLAASSLTTGLAIEQYDQATSTWQTAPRTDFAIGPADDDPTDLRVMRIAGWAKATRYRITLLPSITDSFGRALILPSGESQGVAIELDVPTDGTTPPTYARAFILAYDKDASDTLGGNFPGGQTLLFQGAWTDPITGLGFHRARWLDRTNASWMSEDVLEDAESSNLFSAFGLTPAGDADPSGRFIVKIHEEITRDAARGTPVTDILVDEINRGHSIADLLHPGLHAQHFDANAFPEGISFVDEMLGKFRTEADPRQALIALGRAMHAVQDFYAHSNYAEIRAWVTYPGQPTSMLPLWDFEWHGPDSTDWDPDLYPYADCDCDWNASKAGETCGLHSGYYKLGKKIKSLVFGERAWKKLPMPHHSGAVGINKDVPGKGEGNVSAGNGQTLHEVAKDLATRETAKRFMLLDAGRLRALEKATRENLRHPR